MAVETPCIWKATSSERVTCSAPNHNCCYQLDSPVWFVVCKGCASLPLFQLDWNCSQCQMPWRDGNFHLCCSCLSPAVQWPLCRQGWVWGVCDSSACSTPGLLTALVSSKDEQQGSCAGRREIPGICMLQSSVVWTPLDNQVSFLDFSNDSQ